MPCNAEGAGEEGTDLSGYESGEQNAGLVAATPLAGLISSFFAGEITTSMINSSSQTQI